MNRVDISSFFSRFNGKIVSLEYEPKPNKSNYIKKLKDVGLLENHREIVAEAERLEIKNKATLVLAELLFDQNIHTQVRTLSSQSKIQSIMTDRYTIDELNYYYYFFIYLFIV